MRIATDIGGTFTDMVSIDNDGRVITVKSDTTPPNLEEGVISVIKKSGVNPKEIQTFIHGTTTIINALTERKGAKTALITTKGFRDILEIARCNRPDLFNLVFKKPAPFIPRYLRLEVEERISHDGEIIKELCLEDIKEAVEYLKKEKVDSIAICYLNSYANDSHELKTVEYIKSLWPEVFVASSVEVTKEWREYERTSTSTLNAYVKPIASSYMEKLEGRLNEIGLNGKKYIMQSNGGTTTFEQAKKTPINMVESGPVAGVFGSAVLGQAINEKNMIAFDVGGTTAKCSLIDGGNVKITTDYRIERTDSNAGYPIMTPVVDIVEIGNGGGSIAWIDETGSLKVGPKSAGALPGPVAYGKGGTLPTTTDACLITGRLSPSNFEGKVDLDKVRKSIMDEVGNALNLSPEEAAMGIIRVAEANMYNALKLISVRRGYDPRDFTMVAFGGGGPMHGAFLAKELNIKKVIIPTAASVFAAWGMLMTDMRHDYIQTKISPISDADPKELNSMWDSLLSTAKEDFANQGVEEGNMVNIYFMDMRYAGQEHTVKVQVPKIPWDEKTKEEILERFHNTHEHLYTYKLVGTPVEIVNLHLAANGRMEKVAMKEIPSHEGSSEVALKEMRKVYFTEEGFVDTPIYAREKLLSGAIISGPAIVEEVTSSTVVCSGQTLSVDKYGNLIIEMGGK